MTATLGQILNAVTGIFRWWVLVMPWESALRVRAGRWLRVLDRGIWLRIPFLDQVYRQTTRLRIVALPMQTLTTSDVRRERVHHDRVRAARPRRHRGADSVSTSGPGAAARRAGFIREAWGDMTM